MESCGKRHGESNVEVAVHTGGLCTTQECNQSSKDRGHQQFHHTSSPQSVRFLMSLDVRGGPARSLVAQDIIDEISQLRRGHRLAWGCFDRAKWNDPALRRATL